MFIVFKCISANLIPPPQILKNLTFTTKSNTLLPHPNTNGVSSRLIGKITRGNYFKGLLQYLLEKETAYCLGSNIDLSLVRSSRSVGKAAHSCSPLRGAHHLSSSLDLAHRYAYEFNFVAGQMPDVKRPVYHISLSIAPEEHLSDEQWDELARRYLKERGFENSQYVLVRHNDRGHEHCHIVTNQVDLEGQVVDVAWDYYKSQEVIRPLEVDYNLRQLQNSWEIDRSSQPQREVKLLEKTQQASVRRSLQQTIDRLSIPNLEMVELVDRLNLEGIKVKIHQRGNLFGISYQQNGINYPGYKLGKAYSFRGLQKHRGISFDLAQTKELVNIAARSQQSEVKLEPTSKLEINNPYERSSIAVKGTEQVGQDEPQRHPAKTMATKNFDASRRGKSEISPSIEPISERLTDKIDLSKSQSNQSRELPSQQQELLSLTQEKQIGLDYTPAPNRPHPMLAKIASFKKQQPQQPTQAEPTWYGDSIFETAIALLNKYGQETRPRFITTERDNYLISRQEFGKRNYLTDSMSLRLCSDCSRLSIFDFKNNRTILAVNFRSGQSQQYFSRIDVNDNDKKRFQAFANQLKQLETRQQQRAIELQQQFEDSPRYGHAKEVARDIDLYLTSKSQKQTDNIVTFKDGFKLHRLDENNLEVTRNDGSIAFAVNQGIITQYDRNKLEDNLYKNIRAELKTSKIPLEPVSIEQLQRNQTRDYLGVTMRSYGMRDPHRNLTYFEDHNLKMEHSYTHRTGKGFRHKLQVFDRTDNNRLILEYHAIEKSATIKSPDWLLEKEDLSSRNLKYIGKIGRETERLNKIRNFRDYALEIVASRGQREPHQFPRFGTYESPTYLIQSDRDRLIVRDKARDRDLLNISNDFDDLKPELNRDTVANFTMTDFDNFHSAHRKIEKEKQQQLERQRQREIQRRRTRSQENELEL